MHENDNALSEGFEPIAKPFPLIKMQLMYEQHITVFVLSKINFIYEFFNVKKSKYSSFFSFSSLASEFVTKLKLKIIKIITQLRENKRNKDGKGDIFSGFLVFLLISSLNFSV